MSLRDRVRWAAGRAPLWALLLFGLSGALLLLLRVAADFPRLGEAGYPDSSNLYDAEQFRRTGVIYRDPTVPPYPPGNYSPLLYVLLSVPGRILETTNPFLGPRVVILLAFVACVAATGSIARALVPVRAVGPWGLLLASAIGTMPPWVLQLRGDFPGAAFGLLSVRLLLASGWWAPLLAGVAAGMAFQFKITFVAALAAGGLWLLALRRWRDCAQFAAAGALFALGPYLYFQLREPQTIAQMLSLNPLIRDYPGLAHLALKSTREPVCLLALAALPLVLRRGRRRWWLLLLFAAVSLAVALVTDVQAGGNSNYFFEGLFALTPLAALGALRLAGGRWRQGTGGLLAAALLVLYVVLPNLAAAYNVLTGELSPAARLAERRPIEMLRVALPGHRVLSTVPRVSILTDEPVITEPFLLAYYQLLGKFDTGPLRDRIRRQDFEAVVTKATPSKYRGVPQVPPDLWSAIAEAYQPFCAPSPRLVVRLPRGAAHGGALGARLRELGCAPLDTTGARERQPHNAAGEPWPIPGTIEAEDYDEGTPADPAYHDVTRGSDAPATQHYRDDDVDLGVDATLSLVDVGWIEPGEWLEYSVRVEQTGLYRVAIRIASPLEHKRLHLEFNGVDRSGAILVPNTGCWGSDLRGGHCFQDVAADNLRLDKGVARMRLVVDSGGYTIDRLTFTREHP